MFVDDDPVGDTGTRSREEQAAGRSQPGGVGEPHTEGKAWLPSPAVTAGMLQADCKFLEGNLEWEASAYPHAFKAWP